jgi:hypothetical protein
VLRYVAQLTGGSKHPCFLVEVNPRLNSTSSVSTGVAIKQQLLSSRDSPLQSVAATYIA